MFDIETTPLEVYSWGLRDQFIQPAQIIEDWNLLSYAAKFLDVEKMYYQDLRNSNVRNDRKLLIGLTELINESDAIITKNGFRFDLKKLKARCVIMKVPSPKPVPHIDTERMARQCGFSSHGLEYLSETVNDVHTKAKHGIYPGLELWKECLKGNIKAFRELEQYNKKDVLATEEQYKKLLPHTKSGVNLNILRSGDTFACQCGSTHLVKRGFSPTNSGKFQRYLCMGCGAWLSESGAGNNMLTKAKLKSLRGK